MKMLLNDFLLITQFFTRIPINKNLVCEQKNFRRGLVFLPLVGGIIGGIQWGIFYLLHWILPASIVAAFVMLSGILLTGALHIDGLGDCCDGFFSSKGKERTIEIMKDSRIGAYGGIGIIFDLLFRYAALTFLIQNNQSAILFAAPVVGRVFTIFLCLIGKNAKATGSGNIFIQNVNIVTLAAGFIIGEGMSLLVLGISDLTFLLIGGIVTTLAFNQLCSAKIGGLTGDTLGANYELVEILSLIIYIGMHRF